jgi:outer membrane immunogenic protein
MLKLISSVSALGLLSVAAHAADLPVYNEPAPVAPVVAPAYDWTGFYLGAHGGYSWGESDIDTIGTIDDFDGGLVGGQLGVNWQWNSVVFGVEGDASWSMADTSATFLAPPITIEEEANWLASIRGRIGLGFDRFLVYGTGGAAWVDVDAEVPGIGSDSNTHFGWVAGGGAEFLLTQNISLGAEYLHYEFGDETYTIGGVAVDGDGEADVIRGRLNFKFSGLLGGR